jgi:UPF0755 protein
MLGLVSNMTPTQSPSRNTTCCLLIVFILLLAIFLVWVIPGLINSQAEERFGKPTPGLTYRQHVYLSAMLLLHVNDLTQPMNPQGGEINLAIEPGESVSSITQNLERAGLIPNANAFRNYLLYAGLDVSLKAGEYQLDPAMSPIDIAQAIQSSISAEVTLTILPGWRMEEVANSLYSSGYNVSADEFLNAVQTHPAGYSFSTCLPDDSLEGYLFPGSYTLPRESTAGELLDAVLMNFEAQVSPELRAGFNNQGLNLCQAVTLASIVQREAVVDDEMPLIASVFYNRLNSGSELASDPTVQYALGFNQAQATWWTNPLSAQDLQIDSPYNTYIHAGLPPGPISNPGLAALDATAFPAQTSYYYFRAACDGSGRHLFAETYTEHLENACP